MRNEYISGLEKELDSLIDEMSEFKLVGKDKIKVLVDKESEVKLTGLKIKISNVSNRYLTVEQRISINGVMTYSTLGRRILGMKSGDYSVVCDHRNRNPLDNRKVNLRVATRSQNSINRLDDNKSSSFKHIEVRKNGSIRLDFTFRKKRTGVGSRFQLYFSKDERLSCIAMLADCISVLYDRDYSVTNFDKSIYTPVFIDTYLDIYKVDRDKLDNCIKSAK